jgi:hypothetical protein
MNVATTPAALIGGSAETWRTRCAAGGPESA